MRTAEAQHRRALPCLSRVAVSIAAVLLVVTGCSPSAGARDTAPQQGTLFSRAELLEDVAYIFATIRDVHPNPHHRVDSAAVMRARQALERGLHDDMSAVEFWRLAAPAVALLRDGHTSLSRPDISSTSAVFPLVVKLDSTGATVRADLSDEARLPRGARLLLINGRSVASLVGEAMTTLPYERHAMRLWVVERVFGDLLPVLWDWRGPYEIEAELPSGERLTAVLSPISREEGNRRSEAAGLVPAPAPAFSYATLGDGVLGYIDLRLQLDVDRFERFLDETFTRVREAPPCALVIDLRRNPGGSAEFGDLLMSYLAARPVRQYSRIDVRSSAQVKAHHRQRLPRPIRWLPAGAFGLADRRFGALLGSPDGAIVTWTEDERLPRRNPLRWTGPVFVLTGVNTFSSGADLAAALQDYGLATVIGEETGGLASSYGESYASHLPHTALRLNVSYKYFVRPSGIEDDRGVVPDIVVAGDPGQTNGDPALDRVLQEVGPCAAQADDLVHVDARAIRSHLSH